jgi:hypothetical protein
MNPHIEPPKELRIFEGTENKVSPLNNPFEKKCVKCVNIFAYPQEKKVNGSIEFVNGDTEGKQKFTDETIFGIIKKMEAFVETL